MAEGFCSRKPPSGGSGQGQTRIPAEKTQRAPVGVHESLRSKPKLWESGGKTVLALALVLKFELIQTHVVYI